MRTTYLAHLISIVFHPVFVNALALFLLINLDPHLSFGLQPVMQWFYQGCIFITAALIPLVLVLTNHLFYKKSLLLPDKEDRNFPYIVTAIVYLFDFYLAKSIGTPKLIVAYLLANSSIVVAVLITNLFYKISIHAASMGALLAIACCAAPGANADLRFLIAAIAGLSGLVLTARLTLNAHTPFQVYSGFATGCFIMWFIL